ncbi:MAG: hypothetical protein H6767_01130 [Candidatus Peribacteria bacterium]|nr:MAG: hypothetical protein H6767_01130 [Candidatus Peribacteria bacterium]
MPQKKKNITIRSSAAEYLSYASAIGDQKTIVELRYEDENLWMTQKLMAELYGVSVPAINQHIKTLMRDGEIGETTIKQYLIVGKDGKNRDFDFL